MNQPRYVNQFYNEKQKLGILQILFFLYIFSLAVWPEYAVLKMGGLPGFNLQRILFICLLVLWLIFFVSHRYYINRLIYFFYNYKKIFILFGAFFFLKFISTINSYNFKMSFFASINEFLQCLMFFVICITIINNMITKIQEIFINSLIKIIG